MEEKQETEIAFTGDIGFDHFMDHKWEDEELLDPEIVKFLTSADHVAANVEGPLVGKDAELVEAREMRLMHTIDPAAVSVLDRIRADIWNLCNNHIMDAGQEGLKLSIKAAKDHGVSTLGVGMNIKEACRPVILDEAGGIGLFAVGYRRGCKPASDETGGCLCWNEMERIAAVIKDIKAKCHWCIVVAHGGEEFTALPSPYTRKRYLDYLEMGADLVVCHHPHVPMNYELVGEKAIFYSLGNFIFDTPYQRAQLYTECGILLKIKLTHESWSFEALGLKTDRDKERVVKADLPDIFENVPEEEYELLSPLSAKAFVAATKRQQIFLHPDEFADASEDKWKEHFADPKRSGRVEGEGLDFFIICPLAERTAEGLHERSRLKKVKDHIMRMM
ncbi:MAG: CapA family protein [Lachnospiraceae bacterium]|nr:CapA family protein [Lachnospiraceae bacterium]